ncbi:MAG: terminase large subunit domain-containing protein, partial [Janthinobacterium lividum]
MITGSRNQLTRPQFKIYNDGWKPECRHRVAVCGRRFGKTFLGVEEIRRAVSMAIKNKVPVDNEIWYGTPELTQAKKNMWLRLVRGIPDHWVQGKPNKSTSTITIKSGHIVRLVGLDQYESLRGSGLWFFCGDEWADTKAEAWEETIAPMLITSQGHSLFIGTPKGFNHLYDDYNKGFDPKYSDWKSYLYTTMQGGHVPQSEIDKARFERDPRTFRQEYQASFETYAGRVVYAYSRKNNTEGYSYIPYRGALHIGMDFNVNPMTATVWQEYNGNSYQIDEIIIPTSNTAEMAQVIAEKYALNNSIDHITIYPDASSKANKTSASGETDLTLLQGAGFNISVGSVNPKVRDRINSTNARFTNELGQHHAFVAPQCKKSIAA